MGFADTDRADSIALDATESEAGSPSFEDTVLSLLTEMSQRLSVQEERITAVERADPPAPRFIDPQVNANTGTADRSRRALAAAPDGIPHSDKIPQFPNGEKIPQMVMRQYRPKFGSGDIVQLDLAAVPHGRSDGKTRGALMGDAGVPNGYGEVFDSIYLSDTSGQWKYRVKFDPKVMPGSNGGLVALYETELLPA